MIDTNLHISQNPSIMSGAPCFTGTRVPVSTLFDNLADGATLSQFVEWFPGVSLQQVKAVLAQASNDMFKLAR
jgi:uncharacterized protein (DUF433 family)